MRKLRSIRYRAWLLALTPFVLIALYIAGSFVYIMNDGTPIAAPNIPRKVSLGNGPALSYVVLGDSTSIGQGAIYKDSYAYQSALHLSTQHRVTLTNVGVSGARAKDVELQQVPKIASLKPDVVLLAIGANDVTHFTSQSDFRTSLQLIIAQLRINNPSLPIVVTGVPAMGSVPRFPPGFSNIATARTAKFNALYRELAASQNLIFAPVADKTGPAFKRDHTLFASDNFHPNARGYALWAPVINNALDTALASTPEQAKQ